MKKKPPAAPPDAHGHDDEAAFVAALADVEPLSASRGSRVEVQRAPAPRVPAPVTPTASASLEGHVAGLDPKVLRRLGRGEPAAEAQLDLHGLHRDEAARKVRAFVAQSVAAGRRAVRIVHGVGLHSSGEPVLPTEVARCLHAALATGEVLAFRPAPPTAGGAGAVHVLLRARIKRP